MKEQIQQAEALYFQSDLNKSQIADLLNTSRRSIHLWIRENNWARLKKSAGHLPGLLAENCYHIISHFTESLLSEYRIMRPITHEESDTLHKLTLTIGKLKNHSTLNERMEMFAVFMDMVEERSPKLADEIKPIIKEYISSQAGVYKQHLMPDHYNSMGFIPQAGSKFDHNEARLDMEDISAWTEKEPPFDPEAFDAMLKLKETPPAQKAAPVAQPATPPHKPASRRAPVPAPIPTPVSQGEAAPGPMQILAESDIFTEDFPGFLPPELSDEEIARRRAILEKSDELIKLYNQRQAARNNQAPLAPGKNKAA